MFTNNKLAQLYPHLNLSRTMTPTPKVSEPPKEAVQRPPVGTRSISIERPKRSPTPAKEVKRDKSPEPVKEPTIIRSVTIVEPPKVEIEEFVPTKPASHVIKRPNRIAKSVPPVPVRDSQVPRQGERGLQRKYSVDQKRQMYLDRLSRKSVANAEKELERVTDVLDKAEHNAEKLIAMERAIKGQLKLINYAKYFSISNEECVPSNIQPNVISPSGEEADRDDVLSEQPEEPVVPEP